MNFLKLKNLEPNIRWLPEIDALKAIAIVLIVLCHMDNYVTNLHIIRLIDSYLALMGVSLFFFISGFTIHHPEKNYTKRDITKFYKRRFYRIYPLYWLSLTLFVIIFQILNVDPGYRISYDIDMINFFIHMVGLQGIVFQYYIQSMWFIGVLLLYYFIYPIVIYFSKNTEGMLLMFFLVLIPFTILLMFNSISMGFFTYYGAFAGGILSKQISLFSNKKYENYKFTFVILFSIIVLLQALNSLHLINYTSIIFVPFIVQTAFVFTFGIVCYWFMKSFIFFLNDKIVHFLSFISYGSYAVYLFHHQFLATFRFSSNFFFHSIVITDLLLLFVAFPILFVFGYFIQKLINNLIIR